MLRMFLFSLFLLSFKAIGAQHQVIDTLGVSPKGQYVAVEEYGYKADKNLYYVKVKIINVWQKKYVGSAIEVELPARSPDELRKARKKAKILAQDELKKFNISG